MDVDNTETVRRVWICCRRTQYQIPRRYQRIKSYIYDVCGVIPPMPPAPPVLRRQAHEYCEVCSEAHEHYGGECWNCNHRNGDWF